MSEAKYIGLNGKAYLFIGSSIRGLARHSPLSANAVTILSLFLWLIACGCVVARQWIAAMVLGIVASFGDAFDGAIAREHGEESSKGGFLDFYADRLGDVTLFAALAYTFAADRWLFVAALLNLGLTQFSSMFRNGLKLPPELVRDSGIESLTKAFPGLNLRRAIVALGSFGLFFGTTWTLSISLWIVLSWCSLVFLALYWKVAMSGGAHEASADSSPAEQPDASPLAHP